MADAKKEDQTARSAQKDTLRDSGEAEEDGKTRQIEDSLSSGYDELQHGPKNSSSSRVARQTQKTTRKQKPTPEFSSILLQDKAESSPITTGELFGETSITRSKHHTDSASELPCEAAGGLDEEIHNLITERERRLY